MSTERRAGATSAPSATPRRPRTIPREARERCEPDAGGGSCCDYFLGRRKVARVYYHPSGAVMWALHFDEDGRSHGVERQEHENGRVHYRARYRHGLQVGTQEQWDPWGHLIVSTKFVRGTGLDLWYSSCNSWEERHFARGELHGVERRWSGTTRLSSEAYFARGVRHGIERQWSAERRLRRGFPRYFVAGEKVDRRAYERARRTDPTLPAPSAKDDRPRRTPPPELVAAARRLRAARSKSPARRGVW